MGSEILVYDEKSIAMAMDAFCQLGSDGGLGKGRIWILLDPNTKRAKRDSPDNLTVSELIGIDTTKMISILKKKWKSMLQSGVGVGKGLHTWLHKGSPWVTIGSCEIMNGDTPENGYLLERGSDDAISIITKIDSKLRQEANKDRSPPSSSERTTNSSTDVDGSSSVPAANNSTPRRKKPTSLATPSPKIPYHKFTLW